MIQYYFLRRCIVNFRGNGLFLTYISSVRRRIFNILFACWNIENQKRPRYFQKCLSEAFSNALFVSLCMGNSLSLFYHQKCPHCEFVFDASLFYHRAFVKVAGAKWMSAGFCLLFFSIEWEIDDKSSKRKFLEICFFIFVVKNRTIHGHRFYWNSTRNNCSILNSSGNF